MFAYLIVFFGAGVGGAMRHAINLGSARLFGIDFPSGTFIVNVTGSFAMGILAGYFASRAEVSPHWRLFLTTGVLGGYTTFSTFSLDFAMLSERGELIATLAYVLGSVALSLLLLVFGIWLMRAHG